MKKNYLEHISFWGNKKILFVIANPHEFGEHLRETGINPLFTGIGTTNAASTMSAALAVLEQQNSLPDLVISRP